jgi:hypothetical protein
MARKPNMTVTTRSLGEKRPIAAKQIPSPFPNPPPSRQPIPRLAFHGPSPKLDCSIEKLTDAIKVAALPDAILFLDTNVFTKELDLSVWDALFSRRILITPRVWKELRPWLKTPFRNKPITRSCRRSRSEPGTLGTKFTGGFRVFSKAFARQSESGGTA